MIKSLKIVSVLFLILAAGCSQSFIKLTVQEDRNPYRMFGGLPERNFFSPQAISDSLEVSWENNVHGNFANSSVVYYDSTIFTGDLGGRIHCFDLRTGRLKGTLKTKGAVYSSPLVYVNRIVYPLCLNDENETELIYYDILNSAELFNRKIEGRILTQLIGQKDDVIFCTENGYIKRYSAAGAEIWSIKTEESFLANPALYDDRIVAGTADGEIYIIDSGAGKILLKQKIGYPFFSGVSIKNSRAFIGDERGILYALDINDGKVLWKYDTGYRIKMNPALDDRNVYIGNLSGDLFSFDQSTGNVNWKQHLNGLLNSTPLVTENRIVVVNLFRSFSLLDKLSGAVKRTYPLEGRGKLSPVLAGNKIIIGYDEGTLRAYEIIY